MKPKKVFVKTLSLFIISMLLTSSVSFGASNNNSQIQRLKSYDELKQIYSKLVKPYAGNNDYEDVLLAPVDTTSAPVEAASSNEGSVSETNVQVQGVDEGDIVKTDGKYIYTMGNNKINIVSTLRTGSLKYVSSIVIDGYPKEMYLKGNKLIYIAQQDMYLELSSNKNISGNEYSKMYSKAGFNYNNYNYKPTTVAVVYDITNPSKPRSIRTVKQDGYYLSSRLVADQLYMVTNNSNYRLMYKNISEINTNAIVPQITDTLFGVNNKLLSPQNISIFPNLDYFSYSIVSGFNINGSSQVTCEATLGGGSNIYSSINNLYVINENYTYNSTYVLKYSLSNGVPKVNAFGNIPGTILNQFSMDEYNGNFRVATTSYSSGTGTTKNNVYILNGALNTIGKIENLAPGERIYSVRFMDKKGYVVTFRQVDPLFALDLSNPAAPKVTGQLKIPGFSSYLHPYSQNLLIGIGNNTKETDYGATVTNGIKLSLFDVSNPFSPKEVKSFSLGTRGTYSEVLNNHKALLFSKEKNIMGFPVELYENKSGGIDSGYGQLTYSGYYIFKIDSNAGFSVLGRITHLKDGGDINTVWGSGLSIKRGVFVDNTLYTISNKMVKANSLDNFKLIQQIGLP